MRPHRGDHAVDDQLADPQDGERDKGAQRASARIATV